MLSRCGRGLRWSKFKMVMINYEQVGLRRGPDHDWSLWSYSIMINHGAADRFDHDWLWPARAAWGGAQRMAAGGHFRGRSHEAVGRRRARHEAGRGWVAAWGGHAGPRRGPFPAARRMRRRAAGCPGTSLLKWWPWLLMINDLGHNGLRERWQRVPVGHPPPPRALY